MSVYDVSDYRDPATPKGRLFPMTTGNLRTLAFYLVVGGVVVYAVSHLAFVRGR